jgi:hypothetical protein
MVFFQQWMAELGLQLYDAQRACREVPSGILKQFRTIFDCTSQLSSAFTINNIK